MRSSTSALDDAGPRVATILVSRYMGFLFLQDSLERGSNAFRHMQGAAGFLATVTGREREVMRRIAAPVVGGMISSTVLTLLVIPVIYAWVKQWQHRLD